MHLCFLFVLNVLHLKIYDVFLRVRKIFLKVSYRFKVKTDVWPVVAVLSNNTGPTWYKVVTLNAWWLDASQVVCIILLQFCVFWIRSNISFQSWTHCKSKKNYSSSNDLQGPALKVSQYPPVSTEHVKMSNITSKINTSKAWCKKHGVSLLILYSLISEWEGFFLLQ